MSGRLDAMAGAAEIVDAVIGVALDLGPPAVTTVGRMHVEPNLPAAVPERVVFTVDSRHPDGAVLAEQHARQEHLIREIAARRGLEVSWTTPLDLPACPCSLDVVSALEEAALRQGVPYRRMHSGAGHDTQNIARVARAAMLFVPSREGRSHTPAEFTETGHAVTGIRVLTDALHALAYPA
jgi:allantoate deiminase